VWPWSYNSCGSIPHLETKQEISACLSDPKHGLNSFQGRGAPEVDIFEVMPSVQMVGADVPNPAFMFSTLNVAPGLPKSVRPKNGRVVNESSEIW